MREPERVDGIAVFLVRSRMDSLSVLPREVMRRIRRWMEPARSDLFREFGLDLVMQAHIHFRIDGPGHVAQLHSGFPEEDVELHAPELVEDAPDEPAAS